MQMFSLTLFMFFLVSYASAILDEGKKRDTLSSKLDLMKTRLANLERNNKLLQEKLRVSKPGEGISRNSIGETQSAYRFAGKRADDEKKKKADDPKEAAGTPVPVDDDEQGEGGAAATPKGDKDKPNAGEDTAAGADPALQRNADVAAESNGNSGPNRNNSPAIMDVGPNDWNTNSELPSTDHLKIIPFGKHIPRDPNIQYIVATGLQECMNCQSIIAEGYLLGPQYMNIFGYNVRDSVNVPLLAAQARVLQACPEFINDWCYQDLGGTQALRAPCPPFLKCHYCLGINPLHCMHSYGGTMPEM